MLEVRTSERGAGTIFSRIDGALAADERLRGKCEKARECGVLLSERGDGDNTY